MWLQVDHHQPGYDHGGALVVVTEFSAVPAYTPIRNSLDYIFLNKRYLS
jgi:hypothetical protein